MRFLLGPELIWLLIYGASSLIAKANIPPNKVVDRYIENSWLWLPLCCLLTFCLVYIPAVAQNWLLPRIWVAGIIGGHISLNKTVKAYSNQGPGIGMTYLLGMMFLLGVLVAGTLFVKI